MIGEAGDEHSDEPDQLQVTVRLHERYPADAETDVTPATQRDENG